MQKAVSPLLRLFSSCWRNQPKTSSALLHDSSPASSLAVHTAGSGYRGSGVGQESRVTVFSPGRRWEVVVLSNHFSWGSLAWGAALSALSCICSEDGPKWGLLTTLHCHGGGSTMGIHVVNEEECIDNWASVRAAGAEVEQEGNSRCCWCTEVSGRMPTG